MLLNNPAVQTPPRQPYNSIKVVRAPVLAALMAAATPAGPPPQTITSVSRTTGISLLASENIPLLLFDPEDTLANAEIPDIPKIEALAPVFKKLRLLDFMLFELVSAI